ncbi:hypothetical protein HYH03_012949 [Edaphochlamys debaryana]|uniref:Uncharacterized protein n=1 Tax=Edaphochlamys debaryana TaxID=47281 RepID=A0A836BTU7_9CHLO|nr:hypothetical protein HYH03_012949 [Edaphochlamys debaryana]|eukprot:KAG2488442.1 hypothetical protein HYH03_012949 [Edaphochlamys debaryana]
MAAAQAQPAAAGQDPVKALMRSATRIVLAFTSSGPAAQPTAAELHAACEQVDACGAAGLRSLLERPASACQLVKLLACALRGADTAAGDISRAYLELAQKLADSMFHCSWQNKHKIALAILRTGSLEACGRLLVRAPALGLDVVKCVKVAERMLRIVGLSGDLGPGELQAALRASGLFEHGARLLLLHTASGAAPAATTANGSAPESGPSAAAAAGTSSGGAGPSNAPAGPALAAPAEAGSPTAIPPSAAAELKALAWVLGRGICYRRAAGPWDSYAATVAALARLRLADGGRSYGLPPQAEAAGSAAAEAAFQIGADDAADPCLVLNALKAWAQACLAQPSGCDKDCGFLPDAGLFRLGLRAVAASLALAERVEVGLEERVKSRLSPLGPSPPPGLAVALSAGALPALERLLRRTNGALRLTDPCHGLGPSRPPAAALLSWPRLRVLLAYGNVRQAASLVATIGKVLALRPAERDGAGGPGDALVLRTLEVASEGRGWAAGLCGRTPEPAAAAVSSGPGGSSTSDGGSASAAFSAADAQLLRLVAWMHARWLPAWAAWGSGVARRLAVVPKEEARALVPHVDAVLAALSYPLDCLPYSIAGVVPMSQTEVEAAAENISILWDRARETSKGAAPVPRHIVLMHEAAATALTAFCCSLAANAMALRPPPTTAEAAAEAASVAAWGQVLLGGTAPVMAFLSDVAAAADRIRLATATQVSTALTAMRNRLRLLLVHYTGPTCSYLSGLAGSEGRGGAAGSTRTPPPRRLQPFLDVVSSRGPQPDPELEDLLLELRRGPVGEARPSGPVELPRICLILPKGIEEVPSLLWPPPLQVCGNGLCGRLEGDSEAFREAALAPCSRGCGVAWFCCAECERAALGEGHGGVCRGGGGAGAR